MLAGRAELELGCQEEGKGRRRHLSPTILQLSCPRQDLREATATGLLKPERSPRGRRGDRVKGATGGPAPVPRSPIKAKNLTSIRVDDSESTPKGSPMAGRGHAIRIPPPNTLMHRFAESKGALNRSLQDGPRPAV